MGLREKCKVAMSRFFHYPRRQEPAYISESQSQTRQLRSLTSEDAGDAGDAEQERARLAELDLGLREGNGARSNSLPAEQPPGELKSTPQTQKRLVKKTAQPNVQQTEGTLRRAPALRRTLSLRKSIESLKACTHRKSAPSAKRENTNTPPPRLKVDTPTKRERSVGSPSILGPVLSHVSSKARPRRFRSAKSTRQSDEVSQDAPASGVPDQASPKNLHDVSRYQNAPESDPDQEQPGLTSMSSTGLIHDPPHANRRSTGNFDRPPAGGGSRKRESLHEAVSGVTRLSAARHATTRDQLRRDRTNSSSAARNASESTYSEIWHSWTVPPPAQVARVTDLAREHPLIENPGQSSDRLTWPPAQLGEAAQAELRQHRSSIASIAERLSSAKSSLWGSSSTLRGGDDLEALLVETIEKIETIEDVKSAEAALSMPLLMRISSTHQRKISQAGDGSMEPTRRASGRESPHPSAFRDQNGHVSPLSSVDFSQDSPCDQKAKMVFESLREPPIFGLEVRCSTDALDPNIESHIETSKDPIRNSIKSGDTMARLVPLPHEDDLSSQLEFDEGSGPCNQDISVQRSSSTVGELVPKPLDWRGKSITESPDFCALTSPSESQVARVSSDFTVAPTPESLDSLKETLRLAINTPLPRSRPKARGVVMKRKGKGSVSTPTTPEERWEAISREKNGSTETFPPGLYSQLNSRILPGREALSAPIISGLSRSASQTSKAAGVSKWPDTGSRFKEVFDFPRMRSGPELNQKYNNMSSERLENPKLRLARLRREADSRSGSSASSLVSAPGVLGVGDARFRSGISTTIAVSPPRSELGVSVGGEGGMVEGKDWKEFRDRVVGGHCANYVRTGFPRWGHEEVKKLREAKLAVAKAAKGGETIGTPTTVSDAVNGLRIRARAQMDIGTGAGTRMDTDTRTGTEIRNGNRAGPESEATR
ncbi:hypothetical protein K458DRAFT_488233 [Lentithecium fluviatile CBS 122367]|uniref:Uncharacterized protein n=1 Tax=Lentithecium fluviatile CBS 122367 TaxID=1168545 RepID=A0A6G1IYR0_9PLEO|nr:hypothetical protein K458DRAFT_488233 [Lentithecium fluviatile CBS 122367]